jgi:gliding motility-associated-like protein
MALLAPNLRAQVDFSGYSEKEIHHGEHAFHDFNESFKLSNKIEGQIPNYIVSDLDKNIFVDFINAKLPNKGLLLKKVIDGNINNKQLTDLYNKTLNTIFNNPSLEADFNLFKSEIESAANDGYATFSRTAGQACVNMDFETGDYSGWEAERGRSCTGGYVDCYTFDQLGSNTGDPANQRQHLIVGAGNDPSIAALSTLSPFGGTWSLRLGNELAGYGAEKIRHTFLVTPGKEILTYAYAVVLQDPGHPIDYQPFFTINIFDSNGFQIPDTCAQYNVVAAGNIPGFQSQGTIRWKDWAQISVNLSPFIGQNLTIEFTTSDCDYGGHWGRAYLDVTCDAPEMSVIPDCNGMILQAPPGYYRYEWRNGISNALIDTTFSIQLSGPGHYVCYLISENGCSIVIDTILTTIYPKIGHLNVVEHLRCYNDSSGSITVNVFGGVPPYRYSLDNGVNWSTNNVFAGLHAGTYTVTVEDSYGCADTSFNHTINEPPPLTLDLTTVDVTCPGACNGGAVATVNGGTPYNTGYLYSWDAAAYISNNIYTGICAGTHTVEATDSNGCLVDSTFIIVEPAPITIDNINVVDEICYNSCQGEIHITDAAAVLYSIDGGSTWQTSGSYTGLCAAASPYYLAIQDTAGCIGRDTIIINQPPPMNIDVRNDTLICYGSPVNLWANVTGGTGTLTYDWFIGVVPVGSGANITLNPTTLNIYTVVATDANGCQITGSVAINVLPPLQVTAYYDTAICEGDSVNIYAFGSGGNGSYAYNWNNGGGPGQYITVFPTNTTTFTVTLSDGCTVPDVQDSIVITVYPLPDVNFMVDTTEGCVPTTIHFTNLTPPATVGSCYWQFGDGTSTSICGQVYHTYTDTGRFDVSLTITSPQGCVSDSVSPGLIWIHPNPIADFEAIPPIRDVWNTEIQFVNNSILNDYNYWTYDIFGTSTGIDTTFIFPDERGGVYDICLEVQTIYNCLDRICKPVIIEDRSYLHVPNAFTPDGDGKNDYFYPVLVGIDENDFTFYVFNRWGDLIFQTDRVEKKWDGTHLSQPAQQDAYVWKVVGRSLETGEMIEKIGHVILMR